MGARGVVLLVAGSRGRRAWRCSWSTSRAPSSDDMAPGHPQGRPPARLPRCGTPERGDVVLFTAPDNGPLSIRRVVAVPGDRVEVHNGGILVNGKPLEDERGRHREAGRHRPGVEPAAAVLARRGAQRRPRLSRGARPRRHLVGDRPPETLADSYFVAADRRTLVRDSRDYGPVPRGVDPLDHRAHPVRRATTTPPATSELAPLESRRTWPSSSTGRS